MARPVTPQDLHTSPLQQQDAEVADWLQREDKRQAATLTLIASENHSSAAVRETSDFGSNSPTVLS